MSNDIKINLTQYGKGIITMSNKRPNFKILPNQIWRNTSSERHVITVNVDKLKGIIKFRLLADNDIGHMSERIISDFLYWYTFVQ